MDRRRFLLGSMVVALGCSARRQQPPLEELYGGAGSAEQPPLIVIPGAFGSRLLDTRTAREVWPRSSAKLLFSSYKGLEVEIDESTLDPLPGTIQPYAVFRQGLGRDFYGQILDTLEQAGGYRRRNPGERVEPGERSYYVYLYDWRLDNVAAVAGLHDLIEQIRNDYGDARLKVDILAHSNGGLLARYYARYGVADLSVTGRSPSFLGTSAIRRLLLVGTPNLGSMQPILSHIRGEEMGLRKVPPEIVATIPGAPQLMPHPAMPWLLDKSGDVIDRDVFSIETWRDFGWSIFDGRVRERTIQRKGGGRKGRSYLGMLEAYLERHLARGRRFLQLMAHDPDPRDIKPFVFGGDCEATLSRLVVEEQGYRLVAREQAAAIVKPLPGIDYDRLINEPGDTVVTRDSLMGSCSKTLRAGFAPIPELAIAHSVFLCERHQFLTGNAVFQNNVLHTLLNLKSPISGDYRQPTGEVGG